jgi:hypothetical protein
VPSSTRHPAILAASLAARPTLFPADGAKWVCSPLGCLNQATCYPFDWILIQAEAGRVSARADLIELVDCLRHHPACQQVPLLVILGEWHRGLIADLKTAGLALIDVRPPQDGFDPVALHCLTTRYPARFEIDRLLSRLCPHLNTMVFKTGVELTTCAACGDRMVLGGERLRSVCRTPGHRHCEYVWAEGKRS